MASDRRVHRRALVAAYVDESAWIAATGARPRGRGVWTFRRWPDRPTPAMTSPSMTYTAALRWFHREAPQRWPLAGTVYLNPPGETA
jgi:hypothetical protein